jgi:putative lipoprotein
MRWVLFLLAALATGCAGAQAPHEDVRRFDKQSVEARADDPAAETYVYRCPDGFVFTAVVGRRQALLLFPAGRAGLRRVRTDAGLAYVGGDVAFRVRDERAVLERGDEIHKGCAVDWNDSAWRQARLSGVDFRAVGREPGWRLDIRAGERFVLITDSGRRRLEFPAVAPDTDRSSGTAVYETRNEKHELRVIIENRRCIDDISGDALPARVTAILDGRMYEGCGRGLR